MKISLDRKKSLVTGGSSGLGAAIAASLAEAGAKVAVNFRTDADGAANVAAAIREKGGEALEVQADVSDPAAVAAMFQRIDEEWGGIDIVVCNAGIDGEHMLSWEAEDSAWRRVVEVNLFGAFHCCREALKRMVPARSGVILTITSVHESIAWSGYSAYAAAKAGVSMMTKTLAQEAAPHGVRVLAIGPGAIKTPINRSVWGDPESMRDLLAKIPLNRMGEPSEIGAMAAFLASDAAAYVTGCTVFVDGGMMDYPSFAHGG
jgi:NAD(P)-dependent dehydrogenase (short-subunit alcohol dehydrogenase family)